MNGDVMDADRIRRASVAGREILSYSGLLPPRPGEFPPVRLTKPRIPPLPEDQWTDVHRELAGKYCRDGHVGNGFKTLLQAPDLVNGIMPLQNYIRYDTSLTTRHSDLLILRTARLLGSEAVWSRQAAVARKRGMSPADLRRIAEGPDAGGLDPLEAILLRLADQLFRNSSVTDATWQALSADYDLYHLMDAVKTVASFTTASLLYNSLGVQPDDGELDRIPADIRYTISVPEPEPALGVARVEPVEGKDLINIRRTWARHPKLVEPQRGGALYIMHRMKLDARYREMLILRTGWNCQAPYEWAQHMGMVGRGRERGLDPLKIAEGSAASGWDAFDAVLLDAADELYRDSVLSDRTWGALAKRFDDGMIMDALFTISNYRMVSMACNAFGLQVDDREAERLPEIVRTGGGLRVRDVSKARM